ncbi:MAG: AAA family ATPase [Anaerolineae bacterium]|nr:AAA family ATPase [Anaerolineae bacterium]
MRLARVEIENFRHIEALTLDFTDALQRVRDVSLIVGPNASGKTTVLDAMGIGLGLVTQFYYNRPGLDITPPAIVRRGTVQARVTYHVRFTPTEIAMTRELYRLAGETQALPDSEEVTFTWEYPDLKREHPNGYIRCESQAVWALFKGRSLAARLLATGVVDWRVFERVGAMIAFDQQRTMWGKTIPTDIWNIINYGKPESAPNDRRTTDPKTILLSLAIRDTVPATGQHPPDQFRRIQQRYAEICAPHTITGLVQDDLGQLDLLFNDGTYEYRYDALSSGEQMLLLFLIRLVSDHIHQSIVLVDEVELHQHPLWQRRLLYLLPRIGTNNQIIATTHSDYLQEVTTQEAIITLGELGPQEAAS